MKTLITKFKTIDDFERFKVALADRMKKELPISNKPMVDGMVIGFILTTPLAKELLFQEDMGRVLDGTLQKLEHIVIWCTNNEQELCRIF